MPRITYCSSVDPILPQFTRAGPPAWSDVSTANHYRPTILGRDMRWLPTNWLYFERIGHDDWDLVEISEEEADVINRWRHGFGESAVEQTNRGNTHCSTSSYRPQADLPSYAA